MSYRDMVFDRPKLERLKKAYLEAVEKHQDTFEFEEHTFLQSYAKYLIEYLEYKLPED